MNIEAQAVLAAIEALGEIFGDTIDPKVVTRAHGIIHKRAPAEINGKKGFLVWDYIIWNEITFDDENGNIISFFNSIHDDKTEVMWDQLVSKYGI